MNVWLVLRHTLPLIVLALAVGSLRAQVPMTDTGVSPVNPYVAASPIAPAVPAPTIPGAPAIPVVPAVPPSTATPGATLSLVAPVIPEAPAIPVAPVIPGAPASPLNENLTLPPPTFPQEIIQQQPGDTGIGLPYSSPAEPS